MPDDRAPERGFVPEPETLVIEDQSLRYGFIQLPKQILWAANLSRDAKMLYAVLLGYAWEQGRCFPGYARLCADLGASENMVRKYMRELEAVRLLSQRRRGLGKTNIYTLHDLRTSKIEVQEPHRPRTSKSEVQEPAKSAGAEPAKSAGKVETVEVETEERDSDRSNIRKVHPSLKNAGERGSRTGTSSHLNGSAAVRHAPATAPNDTGFVTIGESVQARYGRETGDREQGSDAGGERVRSSAPVPIIGDESLSAQEEQMIVAMTDALRREMRDDAPFSSSATRLRNLYLKARVDSGTFVNHIDEARKLTQHYTPLIKKQAQDDGSGFRKKNKMPYFFDVLEDRLGLKPAQRGSGRR